MNSEFNDEVHHITVRSLGQPRHSSIWTDPIAQLYKTHRVHSVTKASKPAHFSLWSSVFVDCWFLASQWILNFLPSLLQRFKLQVVHQSVISTIATHGWILSFNHLLNEHIYLWILWFHFCACDGRKLISDNGYVGVIPLTSLHIFEVSASCISILTSVNPSVCCEINSGS